MTLPVPVLLRVSELEAAVPTSTEPKPRLVVLGTRVSVGAVLDTAEIPVPETAIVRVEPVEGEVLMRIDPEYETVLVGVKTTRKYTLVCGAMVTGSAGVITANWGKLLSI